MIIKAIRIWELAHKDECRRLLRERSVYGAKHEVPPCKRRCSQGV